MECLLLVFYIGWFQNFKVPFVMMIAIPLSLVGILGGHWLMGAFFTATSMIGIIALAGIAVNNSIILLEYLKSLQNEENYGVVEGLIEACATRLRPIALTTITTILGSMTILGDPLLTTYLT